MVGRPQLLYRCWSRIERAVRAGSFFIAALGMAIGIGGSSIISRALGAGAHEKATTTFGNQIALTVLITLSMAALGLYFMESIIPAFGGRGQIYPLA